MRSARRTFRMNAAGEEGGARARHGSADRCDMHPPIGLVIPRLSKFIFANNRYEGVNDCVNPI